MSALVFVTYPAAPGARFDRDYYVASHLPMVEREWGPTGLVSARAFFPEGAADTVAIALLTFRDEAAIDASLGAAATGTVMGDVPNYTDIAPVVSKGVAS